MQITLPFAWEAGREGSAIFLMLIVPPGHQLLAAIKAKGNTRLAACSHSCAPEQAKPKFVQEASF